MPAKRIAIVDRDQKFCETLSEQLGLCDDYVCMSFGDAASALAAIGEKEPDIILLDGGLSDMSAQDFHEALREMGVDAPVIFMMRQGEFDALGDLADLTGINDYLMRPFRFADLLAQVRAGLRLREGREEDDIAIGPYRFRPAAKLLMEGDGAEQKIRLTEKESDILKFLSEEEGQVVSREVLLAEVWGYNSGVTTHTLETHIYRLRQKMERDPSSAEILVTEAGGYRLAR